MANFTEHEGQDSVVVRGSMHHTVMTVSEFEEWLEFEGCTRSPWVLSGGSTYESALVYYPDGGVRCGVMKLYISRFECMMSDWRK